jgi:hypothetical protein
MMRRSQPPPLLAGRCRGPATWVIRAAVAGALLAVFAVLLPTKSVAQPVGADGRIRSGVTFGNGRELGPQVAFQGLLGLAVWYEDQSLEPIHCAHTQDGGATWIPGGFMPGYNDDVGECTVCAGPGQSFFVLNQRAITNVPDLEVRRVEIIGGALQWQPAVQMASAPSLERPTIACDPTTGEVYVSYTHAYEVSASPPVYSATIYFARSGDGGATWSSPVALSPASCNGSQVAVGLGGEVYVVWQDMAGAQIMLRRSLDHGASFEPAVVVGAILENANTTPPGLMAVGVRTDTAWPYSMKVPHYPVLAVDRSAGARRGALYVAWAEMASGAVGPYLGPVFETEPNDYFANANRAEIGQDLIGYVPSVDISEDRDLWYFDGIAGQTVSLKASVDYVPSPPYGLEGQYGVFGCAEDTAGSFYGLQEVARGLFVGSDSPYTTAMRFTLPHTGRYYLPVQGATPSSISYRLELREVQVDPASAARDHRDLVLASSGDGGASWTPKVRASQGPVGYDDILPALAVDELGQVHLAWYGRQDDSFCGFLANTYWSLSRDGGATFLPPQRVSSVASTWGDFLNDGTVAGDRLGLATRGTTAQLLWMDSRNLAASSTDIYGAQIETGGPTAVVVSRFTAEPWDGSVRLRWTIEELADVTGFRLERAQSEGVWEILSLAMPPPAGPEFSVLDGTAMAGERYRYRLEVLLREGTSVWGGPVEIALAPAVVVSPALRVSPNPASGPVAVSLTLPAPEQVSLGVYDLMGKVVMPLHEGPAPAGALELRWEGRTRDGRPVPPGLYWVRARLAGRQLVQRLARVQ